MTTENVLKIKQYGKTVAIKASAITTIKLCDDIYTPIPGKFIVRIITKDDSFILRKNDEQTDDECLDYWISKWEQALENNSKNIFIRDERPQSHELAQTEHCRRQNRSTTSR